jgi:serine phosphatase RsbU (regulator of sigma subunit)
MTPLPRARAGYSDCNGPRLTVHHIGTRAAGEAAACGDFAEHLEINRYRSALVVGDIAGRGAAVGQAARALQAYVRSSLLGNVPLSASLRACDDFFTRSILCDDVPFGTLFIAEADVGSFRYASAGHEPALLFGDNGRHRHLDPTGPILGLRAMAPDSTFGERTLALRRTELLVIVTDGVTEARHREGEDLVFFGSTGVVRAVRDARFNGQDAAHAIHRAALSHANGALRDDASVVVSSVGGIGYTRAPAATMRRYREAASHVHHATAASCSG